MITDRDVTAPVQSQVIIAKEWIKAQKFRNTISKRRSTYGYKHDVEKWSGVYISQDSFNEALDQLGVMRKDDYTCISKNGTWPSYNRLISIGVPIPDTRPPAHHYRYFEQ